MKAFINWSGGKDSALCLFKAMQQNLHVEALVTTLSEGRVTMHGVKKEFIEKQAESIGLPLHFIELEGASGYEEAVHKKNVQLASQGFTHVISGDIFLEDLKQYRLKLYSRDGLECLFPLWGKSSGGLINEWMHEKFKAIIIAVNGEVLNESFCGRLLDQEFINALPAGIDVCGENGEYHSFVFDGPIFSKPIDFRKVKIISKNYPPPKKEKEGFPGPSPFIKFYFQELTV